MEETNKEQRGLERLRSMSMSAEDAGLGLSIAMPRQDDELDESPKKGLPLQLELLPWRPVARVAAPQGSPPSPSPPFPWLLPHSCREEVTIAETNPSRGIDMNRAPDVSSAFRSEALPLRVLETGGPLPVKREREKASFELELERERTCDVSSRTSDEEEIGSTRKKLRLSKEQSALLEESFREHSTLNPKQKNALAKQLNLRPRQVEVWFQNRRARTKLKQTEVDCELLKRCCENLTEENRRLQKELQELRALKAAPPCVIGGAGGAGGRDYYMSLPAATLTMCPSCERVASMDNLNNTRSAIVPFSKPQLSQFAQQSAAC